MPARVITNSQGSVPQNAASQGQAANQSVLSQSHVSVNQQAQKAQVIKGPVVTDKKDQLFVKSDPSLGRSTHEERAKFYTGYERLDLQRAHVQRVRELQEENDYLQREILAKEKEVLTAVDPLVLLADIEHRQTVIARNTGEILKIYRVNEERLRRIKELEDQNLKLQEDIVAAQTKFIATNDMQVRTQVAAEFFVLKSTLDANEQEIAELSKD